MCRSKFQGRISPTSRGRIRIVLFSKCVEKRRIFGTSDRDGMKCIVFLISFCAFWRKKWSISDHGNKGEIILWNLTWQILWNDFILLVQFREILRRVTYIIPLYTKRAWCACVLWESMAREKQYCQGISPGTTSDSEERRRRAIFTPHIHPPLTSYSSFNHVWRWRRHRFAWRHIHDVFRARHICSAALAMNEIEVQSVLLSF